MNYNTVYVGMDVHKESFTLCAYTIEEEKGSHFQKTEADYKNVLKYLEFLRIFYGNDANFICGYEAGCLGYTLYHQLTKSSLVETAKANRLNVYQYFELLLTEIPKHMDEKNRDFLKELLPWSSTVQGKCPSRYKKS